MLFEAALFLVHHRCFFTISIHLDQMPKISKELAFHINRSKIIDPSPPTGYPAAADGCGESYVKH